MEHALRVASVVSCSPVNEDVDSKSIKDWDEDISDPCRKQLPLDEH